MRNLKRALSLALAAIMLIGMMVVGAGAVSYNDFSDRTEIVNKDAVSMLTTLGVIDGKPDGSYAPNEFVTREQMAKMISVIMNQGSDNNELFVGVPSGLTDVAGNWALGHINYCYSLGIIAGRGDGRFDPTANVTASEAAKMLLVAAGYNPATEGFVGADWAVNVNAKASALGLFRNYTKSTMADLNRDDAALIIYNALDIEMIQKYEDGYAMNFNDRRTILSAMYGVYKIEGVVVANQWAELDKTDSEDAAKAGTTVLDDVRQLASTTNSTDKNATISYGDNIRFDVDTTVDMLGKRVTLFIEKTTILSDSKVLGVALKDDVNVIQSSVETQSTAKAFLKGTGLAITKDTEFYVNYGFCKDETTAWNLINNHYAPSSDKFNLNGVEMEIIDHNNDGDVDYVLFLRETLSQVTAYSEKNETVSFVVPALDKDRKLPTSSPLTKTAKVEFSDVVFNDDVTTNDLILYVQYGGRTYISEPEILTGTMSRVDRDKNDELYITVEGETYKQSYIHEVASLVDVDIDHFNIENARTNPGFTTKYDFILDSNGFVAAMRPAEETVTNYALVLDSAWTQNALKVEGQVKILKTDGTEATYYINWNNSAKAFSADGKTSNAAAKKDLEEYLGTRDVNQTTVSGYAATGMAAGTVITYTLSDDDILTITKVMMQNDVNGTTDVIEAVSPFDNTVVDMKDSSTMQDTLSAKYEAGDGYVSVARKNAAQGKTYAIDKNTIAFYYDVVTLGDLIPVGSKAGDAGYTQGTIINGYEITQADVTNQVPGTGRYTGTTYSVGKTFYGVAVGWDHMSDVPTGNKIQVYPVVTKNNQGTNDITKLAEVVLFNSKTANTSANWLFVLSSNALSSKTLELNVIFEDGTAKAIEVSRDDYGSYFDDPDDFMTAYKYSENSDGTYDLVISSKKTPEIAKLLRDGTLEVDGWVDSAKDNVYPTITGKTQIWNVTDLKKASDGDAAAGKFVLNENLNAVLIYNNNDTKGDVRTVVTAWVWDRDEDEPVKENNPIETEGTLDTSKNLIKINAFDGANDRDVEIERILLNAGYTDISLSYVGATNEYSVTAKNANGVQRTFTTKTTWYSSNVVGAVDVKSFTTEADANKGAVRKQLPSGTLLSGNGADMQNVLFSAGSANTTVGDMSGYNWVTILFAGPAGCDDGFTPKTVIKDANGDIVYERTSNFGTNSGTTWVGLNFAVILNISAWGQDQNCDAYHTTSLVPSIGTHTGTPCTHSGFSALPDGTYTWEVTNNGTVLESGSFTVQ